MELANVPRYYRKDESLGAWVTNQRMHYKKKRLSPEKILLLEDLGFTWDLLETQWQASYAKLKTFRSIHGHCNVSVVYKKDKLLGNWAHNQRQMYKKGILTQDRVKMLNLLGFVWHQ